MTAEAHREEAAPEASHQVPTHEPHPEPEPAAQATDEVAAADDPPVDAAADPQAQIAELQAQNQRLAADFANYQKRVNRDKAKWTQDAVRDLVGSMLPVLDNLEHAIASCQGDVKDPAVFRQGVELVQSELLRILKGYALEPIDASEGTPFDPDAHQAISLIPADDVEEDVVAAVARTGYRLGEAIVRPAQVVIKKPS